MKRNTASAKILTCIALTATCVTSISNAAIIAKWSFDEESGPTAFDSVGTYHGTLSPSGATFVSGGVSGGAISITKALGGFVSMGNTLHLTSGDFSLVAWIKTPVGDQTPDSLILGKHAAFSRNGYYIHLNQSTGLSMQSANRVFFYQGGTGFAAITAAETPLSTSVVNDGNWHQVVAVYRAGSIKSIYVDGSPVEDSKPSQCFIGNNVPFLIGGVSENGVAKSRLNGTVDEVQIYNHALSDADVDFLFQNPAAIALDCEQKSALLAADLAAAQQTIVNLQTQLAAAEEEVITIEDSLARLASHLQGMFRDPGFELNGTSAAEKTESLVRGIEQMNRGTKQDLYFQIQAQP